MAFIGIGSEDFHNQIKQLKTQLAAKDHEITSVRNENKKCLDELDDVKRAKQAAEYKLDIEQKRFREADGSSAGKAAELATIRLQYDNLHSTLRAANERLKASERENQRLEYELDATSSGDTKTSLKRMQDERQKLEEQVKALEEKVRHLETELEATQGPSRPTGSLLKKSSTSIFPQNSPPRGKSRRRSDSVTDPRIAELEGEVSSLRSAQGPLTIQLDKVRNALSIARREVDKATNAKMALERSSKREIDDLREQLDEVNYELDGWRRDGEGSGMAQLDGLKKELRSKQSELAQSEEKAQSLEADLSTIQEQVKDLQAQLEAVKATSATDDGAVYDRSSRQLTREIKSLQNQIDSLEEDLRQQDEEILRMKGAVPLPGSPKSGQVDFQLSEVQAELEKVRLQLAETEQQLETYRNEGQSTTTTETSLQAMQAELITREKTIDMLETQLAEVEARAREAEEETVSSLGSMQEQLQETLATKEALQTQLHEATAKLSEVASLTDTLQEQFEETSKEKLGLERALSELRESIANRSTESESQQKIAECFDHQEELRTLRQELREARALAAKDSSTVEASQIDLMEARHRVAHLEMCLARITPLPGSSSLDASTSQHMVLLQDKIGRLRAERDELRSSLHFVQHENRFARDATEAERLMVINDLVRTRTELQDRTSAIDILKMEYEESKDRLQILSSQLDSVNESHASASSEKANLISTLAELEKDLGQATAARDELSNRVTELDQQLSEKLQESQSQVLDLINTLALERSRASHAEVEMGSLRRSNKEFEGRVDQLQAALEEKNTVDQLPEPERPASRASRPSSRGERPPSRSGGGIGHIRRLSERFNPDTVESLRAEKADLQGRVQRRDMRIESMTGEINRLKTHLHFAEEAVEDITEEKQEVDKELETLRSDMETHKTNIALAQQSLRDSVLTLAMHRRQATLFHAQSLAQTRSLAETDETIDRIRFSATTAMQSALDQIAGQNQQLANKAQELATARDNESLAKDGMSTLQAVMEGLVRERKAAHEQTEQLRQELQDSQRIKEATENMVGELTTQLEQSRGIDTDSQLRIRALETDLQAAEGELQIKTTELETLDATMSRLQMELADKVESARQLERQVAELTGQVEAAESALMESEGTKLVLESQILDKQKEIDDLAPMTVELRTNLQKVSAALNEEIAGGKARVAQLEKEVEERSQLPGTSTLVSSAEMAELEERIHELESSLSTKVQEVDEADDRVREVYKSKAKSEKKVAKLQRQLATAATDNETAANTAANKVIPLPPSDTQSAPSIPTKTGPSPRAPLRSINIFAEPRQPIVAAGMKRTREKDEPEKPLPAECIVLPNPEGVIRKTPQKTPRKAGQHTPTNHSSAARRARELRDVFAVRGGP